MTGNSDNKIVLLKDIRALLIFIALILFIGISYNLYHIEKTKRAMKESIEQFQDSVDDVNWNWDK